MRHMKKFASLLLAMMMVMALALPALADGDGNVEGEIDPQAATKEPLKVAVSADPDYNYQIYQIFKAAPGSGGLEASTIAWGDSVKDPAAFVQLLKDTYKGTGENPGIFDTADAADPAGVAQIISDNFKATADAKTLAELIGRNASTLFDMVTFVPAPSDAMNQPDLYTGWWLMEERVEGGDPNDVEYRVHQVTTATLNIEPKKGKPSVEKEVANANATGGWSNAAIVPTGEDNEFQFKLTATLPTNFKTEYRDKNKDYVIAFHDRHDAGLTVVQDPAKLTVAICDADGNVLKTLTAGTDYTVNWSGDTHTHVDGKPDHENCDFVVTVNNLVAHNQAVPEGKVVVTYSAYLNEGADLTSAGNMNNVWLEAPDSDENEDNVKVYSLKINISKVDGGTPARALEGATFQLEKKNADGEYENVGEVKTGTANADGVLNQFDWEGLTPGDYRLTEVDVPTQDPDGNPMTYTKIDPIEFTIAADLASDGTLTVTPTGDITFSVDQGVTKADIVNRSGIILPSTGGIGTTIFYVLGGLLVAGAVILLVTKRRMSASEE